MKIQHSSSQQRHGYLLLTVMIMCAATVVVLASLLRYNSTTSYLNQRSNELSLCQNAAEAATEKVYAQLAYDFEVNGGLQTVSNSIVNNVYREMYPNTNESAYFNQFQFKDPTTTNSSYHVYAGFLTNYSGPLPTQYTNEYAASNSMIYRLVCNANMPNGYDSTVVGTAQEDVLLALLPINTYAIFYNGELEFSDCATMTISGRTHSNADICTGAGSGSTCTFGGAVTCSTVIQSPERGGITYSFNQGTTYSAGWSTDVVSVGISIPMTNTQSIIQIQNPSVLSPTSIQGQQMEFYDAQVVMIITNSPSAAYGTNPVVYLTLQNAYNQNVPATDPAPENFELTNATTVLLQTNANSYNASNVITLNKIALPFLTLTNTFCDQREHQTNMFVTQIDVGAYADWAATNSVVTNKMMPSNGNYPLILYVADRRNIGTNKLAVVRLKNAQRLPYNNNLGWTVATQNPLYVWGNYNITTNRTITSTNTSMTMGATTNGFTVPAALISDAITILSSNWSDSLSTSNYTARTAANTSLNAAIITGNVPSTSTSATTFSGGVHNLTRLLETWTGFTLTYNTSIVCLFGSQMATNQFQMPGNYYDPPTRDWSFDPTFYNPAREPPGIPVALVPIRFNWMQPPPGSVTTGMN